MLTTGDVARALGTSRQHVVDLCQSGRLPFVTVGTHRRIDPLALEAFLANPPPTRGLRREQLASLWLHHAVAGHLVRDPDVVLKRAEANLVELARRHPSAQSWFHAWRRVLDGGPADVLRVLVSPSQSAAELRQNSPFAGVLEDGERRRVMESFRRYRDSPA